jgi:hypothetical protein
LTAHDHFSNSFLLYHSLDRGSLHSFILTTTTTHSFLSICLISFSFLSLYSAIMYKLLLWPSLYTLVTLLAPSQASELVERQNCAASYTACNPAGASTTSVPSVGTGLSQIYVDLLDSITGITAKKRDVITPPDSLQPRSSPGLCCTSPALSQYYRRLTTPQVSPEQTASSSTTSPSHSATSVTPFLFPNPSNLPQG